MFIQATCVAIDGSGVLIRGRPGSGKSDLALRLIDGGAALVADDGVEVAAQGGALYARYPRQAPPELRGRMEIRGLGIVEVGAGPAARVVLLVDLAPPEAVAHLPEPETETILNIDLFRLKLTPFEASAPAKVRVAVRQALSIIRPP
ncbi:MAG TPA: HPr kinase/phosphatase C-terminal domain-containing protein [Dongiaceae bacterium]|jgi:serine kinase of HPr protein (carbohydrate metabolism regulator)